MAVKWVVVGNRANGVVLTNNDLTADITLRTSAVITNGEGVRTGKWYWEVKVENLDTLLIGVASSTLSYNGLPMSSNENVRYYSYNGKKFPDNYNYGSSFAKNDIISVLLDLDNGTLEFWKNGTSLGIHSNDISKLLLNNQSVYPSLTAWSSTVGSSKATGIFNIDSFYYNYPSGYQTLEGINKSFILFDGEYKKFGGEAKVIPNQNLIPTMTSSTTPSGRVICSTEGVAYALSWMAFNNDINDGYSVIGTSAWIGYEFESPCVIYKYTLTIATNQIANRSPKSWTFEGSNNATDSSGWEVLHTGESIISDWSLGVKREFELSNEKPYRKYRVNIFSLNGGNYTTMGEIEMFGDLTTVLHPSWETISTTLPSLDTFKDEGMSDLSILDRQPTTITIQMDDNTPQGQPLGSGRVFKEKINLKKYMEINSINVK